MGLVLYCVVRLNVELRLAAMCLWRGASNLANLRLGSAVLFCFNPQAFFTYPRLTPEASPKYVAPSVQTCRCLIQWPGWIPLVGMANRAGSLAGVWPAYPRAGMCAFRLMAK